MVNNSKVLAAALVIFMFSGYSSGEVFFVPGKTNAKGMLDSAHVLVSGEITDDDIDGMLSALENRIGQLLDNPGSLILVLLDSPGGDVTTALELGRFLRELSVWTIVDRQSSCSSSCVFLFSAGVRRWVQPGGKLGFHRPRFEYSHFAGLTSEEAARAYEALIEECEDYMSEMGINDRVLEEMLRTPSHDVHWVDREKAVELGLDGDDPAWAEWRRAQQVQRYGEVRVQANDLFGKCLNSGKSKSFCDDQYKKFLASSGSQ